MFCVAQSVRNFVTVCVRSVTIKININRFTRACVLASVKVSVVSQPGEVWPFQLEPSLIHSYAPPDIHQADRFLSVHSSPRLPYTNMLWSQFVNKGTTDDGKGRSHRLQEDDNNDNSNFTNFTTLDQEREGKNTGNTTVCVCVG